MKTALEQLIEEMQKYTWGHYDPISTIKKYLPKERAQIEIAYGFGRLDRSINLEKTASDYFTQTYKTTDDGK